MSVETKEKTFEQLAKDPVSTVYHDEFREGLRFIVVRGPASLCAYVGVFKDHPLAGYSYDDLPSIECHGGLTFAQDGGKPPWADGYWWYGWDYGHAGDVSFYDLDRSIPSFRDSTKDRAWTVSAVVKDSWSALYEFGKLLKFCERVNGRRK